MAPCQRVGMRVSAIVAAAVALLVCGASASGGGDELPLRAVHREQRAPVNLVVLLVDGAADSSLCVLLCHFARFSAVSLC